MSVSSTNTSNADWQHLKSLRQQRRQDFNQLTQSVQQGDIAGAQQALAALQQLNGSNNGNGDGFSSALKNAISAASSTSSASANSSDPFAALNNSQASGSAPRSDSPIASLLDTLGQDLQSGNLSQAQQAFQQLQQGLQADGAQQASGPHHHHHHHGGGGEQQNDSGLQSLLNAADGSQPSSGTIGSASAANNVQQLQAALSLYQANAGGNDISSLLMSMSV